MRTKEKRKEKGEKRSCHQQWRNIVCEKLTANAQKGNTNSSIQVSSLTMTTTTAAEAAEAMSARSISRQFLYARELKGKDIPAEVKEITGLFGRSQITLTRYLAKISSSISTPP